MSFRKVKLGEIADITKLAGYEFTKHISYDDGGEIIALRALNLNKGQLDLSDVQRISKKTSDGLIRSKLFKGDILLSYTGTLGNFAFVDRDDTFHLAPNVCRIRVSDKCIPEYLYYVIASPFFQKEFLAHSHGSTQATVPMKNIRMIEVYMPNIEVQKRVVNTLEPIDQKIELNRKMNKTLEEMCRALFKKYFIDSPESREWEWTNLGSMISPERGKSLLRRNMKEGSVPVVSGGLEPSGYSDMSNTTAPVITVSASGANAGYVRLWHDNVWSADSCFIDTKITKEVYFFYIFLKIKQDEIYSMQTGAAQPHIYPSHLERLKIKNIPKPKIKDFSTLIEPLFLRIGTISREVSALSSLRDSILPRLMSGKVKV